MSERDDDNEKSEEATPERRRRARGDGQFPRARDLGAMAASTAVLALLASTGVEIAMRLRDLTTHCLSQAHNLHQGGTAWAGAFAARTLMWVTLPAMLVALVAATVAGFVEAGWNPKLEFKWDRLEPLSKLQQLISPKTAAVNTALALGRVAVVVVVAYFVIESALPMLVKLTRTPLVGSVSALGEVVSRLALWATVALATMTALDYAHSWWKHERDLRMSREEIKEEVKGQEGDPRVRARQRARAREMLRRGIRKEVKSADVIVTNPTHVAVAIRYRPEEGAPVVAAKGYDEVAMFIRSLAKEHGIPIVENKPLARTLAERVKAGRAVPVELYAAIAEVLAFVYRLRNRGIRA